MNLKTDQVGHKQRDAQLLVSAARNYNLVVDVLLTLQPKNQGVVSGDAVGRKLRKSNFRE